MIPIRHDAEDKEQNRMADAKPIVSVVLPVYNEETYLADTIDSILAQSHTDFELILSDNASTDGTEAICREKAGQDSRIRYSRHETNVGGIQNFWLSLRKCRGEFFVSAGGHDRWAPNFVEACLRPLKDNPDVVMAYSAARWLEEGDCIGDRIADPLDTRSMTTTRRFLEVIRNIHSYAIYGMYRRSVFEKIPPMPNCLGPDLILLAELSLIGSFAFVSDTEFYMRRTHDIAHLQQHFNKIHLHLGPGGSAIICADLFRHHFALVEKYGVGRWNRIGIKWLTAYSLLHRWRRLLLFILMAGWAPYWTNRLFRALGKPEPLDAPQQVG